MDLSVVRFANIEFVVGPISLTAFRLCEVEEDRVESLRSDLFERGKGPCEAGEDGRVDREAVDALVATATHQEHGGVRRLSVEDAVDGTFGTGDDVDKSVCGLDLVEEVLHGSMQIVVDIARDLVATLVLQDGGGGEQCADQHFGDLVVRSVPNGSRFHVDRKRLLRLTDIRRRRARSRLCRHELLERQRRKRRDPDGRVRSGLPVSGDK